MSTLLSAIQNSIYTTCQLPALTRKQALIASLLPGILLGLAGCIIGALASLPALIIVSALILGISLLITGILLCRHLCPLKLSFTRKPSSPEPSEGIPEILELEIPESPIPSPPPYIPPKPLRNTAEETLFGWNRIESVSLFPYFLSSDRILLFKNHLDRFKAWNMPGTHTIFISTSGRNASLKLQSELPAAIINPVRSASCKKEKNDLLSLVVTDKCWEQSRPNSGVLLAGECSSAPWDDNDRMVPHWDSQTQTYNKPTLLVQAMAPKASCQAEDPTTCYKLCFKTYMACFEEALHNGCRIIQTSLLASSPNFLPESMLKHKQWIGAAKLALLHAVEKTSYKHRSEDIIIVLTHPAQLIFS